MEPLYYSEIPELPDDPSAFQEIEFHSSSDGFRHGVEVYSPPGEFTAALPLLIAPHPITWTARQDYCGGLPDLKRKFHRGYYGLAAKHRIIIAMPHGHHRLVDNSSLAYPPQIEDMARIPDILENSGFAIDRRRMYACGLSMGGLEALVLAGYQPDLLAGVVAFNPIVDLAAWQEDMAVSELPEITEYGTAQNIAREVGGTPEQAPGLYAERSALQRLENLAQVPALVFWSEQDIIVPRQLTHHTYRLYQLVKSLSPASPYVEYNHTNLHGVAPFDRLARWRLHEWCDYDWAIQWLLQHEKVK